MGERRPYKRHGLRNVDIVLFQDNQSMLREVLGWGHLESDLGQHKPAERSALIRYLELNLALLIDIWSKIVS